MVINNKHTFNGSNTLQLNNMYISHFEIDNFVDTLGLIYHHHLA